MQFKIPSTVVVLGLVSFLTDCSSEMIYPLLPLFLTAQLGASAVTLGLIEGLAESTSAILKLFSGAWVDRFKKKKPIILLGYTISGIARPLIGLAQTWPFVLFIRFTDRIGKGLRTSPRDALIAEVTDDNQRGRAYGFHRAMDHAGAVVGPMLASLVFLIPGFDIRDVFLMAAIPALLSIAVLWFFVHEKNHHKLSTSEISTPLLDWSVLNGNYKKLLFAFLIFTLGNSTDAFLLLRLAEVGVSPGSIAVLWSVLHLIKMTSSYFGGYLVDWWGSKKVIFSGWIFYAFIYLAFSAVSSKEFTVVLFLLYGIHFGLIEPAERTLVSLIAGPKRNGTAFGFFHLTIGLAALPASLIFGLVWHKLGYAAAFQFGAVLAGLACLVLFFVREKK